MINLQIKRELESIICRLDDRDEAEGSTKDVLVTLLAAIETNQEPALWNHVRKFSWALIGVLAHRRVARRS
jgi:hypothetical protein